MLLVPWYGRCRRLPVQRVGALQLHAAGYYVTASSSPAASAHYRYFSEPCYVPPTMPCPDLRGAWNSTRVFYGFSATGEPMDASLTADNYLLVVSNWNLLLLLQGWPMFDAGPVSTCFEGPEGYTNLSTLMVVGENGVTAYWMLSILPTGELAIKIGQVGQCLPSPNPDGNDYVFTRGASTFVGNHRCLLIL